MTRLAPADSALRDSTDRLRAAVRAAVDAARAVEPAADDAPLTAFLADLGRDLPLVVTLLPLSADAHGPALELLGLADPPDAPADEFAVDDGLLVVVAPPPDQLAADHARAGAVAASALVILAGNAAGPVAGVVRDLAAATTVWALAPDGTDDPWPDAGVPVVRPDELRASLARGSPVRLALAVRHQLARLEAALPELAGRVRREAVRQEFRRLALSDPPAVEDPADWRTRADALRRAADDALAELGQRLTDHVGQALLPTAVAANRVANLLEDFSPADMTEEAAGRVVRLRVAVEFRHRAERLLRDLVRERVEADTAVVQAELARVHGVLAAGLAAAGALPAPAVAHPEAMWNTLNGLVHLDPHYQIELPRRTWADRLGYGRRPVFLVMMLASLVGAAVGARTSVMLIVSPVMLFLFVGGVFWSYRSFAQEREELLEKELDRLREGLRAEMLRLVERAFREWLTRAGQAVRDAGKQLFRDADARIRDRGEELARKAEHARREARERLRVVEARAAELRRLGSEVQRIAQVARDAARGLGRSDRWGG